MKDYKTLEQCKDKAAKEKRWSGHDEYLQWILQQDMYHVALEYYDKSAELYASQYIEELKRVEEENNNLRSVMIAAAEEIQSQWQAHCDKDGYGPSNLMHRLEKGIAAYYSGYNAGQFTKLEEENRKLSERIKELEGDLKSFIQAGTDIAKDRDYWKALAEKGEQLIIHYGVTPDTNHSGLRKSDWEKTEDILTEEYESLKTKSNGEPEKEESQEEWSKHWEIANKQLSANNGGGVNPHAYRLGFLDAQKLNP